MNKFLLSSVALTLLFTCLVDAQTPSESLPILHDSLAAAGFTSAWELHYHQGIYDLEATNLDTVMVAFFPACCIAVAQLTPHTSWTAGWLIINADGHTYKIAAADCRRLVRKYQGNTNLLRWAIQEKAQKLK